MSTHLHENGLTTVTKTYPTLADNTAGLKFSEANALLKPLNMADLTANPPKTIIKYTDLFINNEWVHAVSGKKFKTINPVNGTVLAEVAEADKADVDIAVKAARVCYEKVWKHVGPSARASLMLRLAELMERDADILAALDSLDNGKTYGIAKLVDVQECIKCIRYFSGWAHSKITGSTIHMDGAYDAMTMHEPFGVVGAVIPWNFPLMMACWKLGPAMACGNCVVMKTSEKTPLSALHLASLFKEAGFPAGSLNMLSGYGPTAGEALARHPDVDKIAFTGSTPTGRRIMIAAAESNLKKVTLELGGKSPAIVFPDVNLDEAVAGTSSALFFNAAQCCCAGSRTFVHSSIYDAFVAKTKEAAKKIQLSCVSNDLMAMGPVVDDIQHKRIMNYIEAGKVSGAKLECGGNQPTEGKAGFYIEPTVFSNVTDEMLCAKEEIFGPVQNIFKFETLEEVIARANDTSFGLAASVWTKDIDIANVMIKSLKAGTVWINAHNVLSFAVPFGGYKQSGLGRDLGEYAIHEYTQVKAVITQLTTGLPKIPLPHGHAHAKAK